MSFSDMKASHWFLSILIGGCVGGSYVINNMNKPSAEQIARHAEQNQKLETVHLLASQGYAGAILSARSPSSVLIERSGYLASSTKDTATVCFVFSAVNAFNVRLESRAAFKSENGQIVSGGIGAAHWNNLCAGKNIIKMYEMSIERDFSIAKRFVNSQ